MGLVGIFGRPYLDLEPLLAPLLGPLEGGALAAVHEEVCLALAHVPADYTGGSHRSMGIVPPSRLAECHADYVEVIRAMTDAQFDTLRSLADEPWVLDPAERRHLDFGEEREFPLSRRQMRWLNARFGVYFPWKAYVELLPNGRWGDKSTRGGKQFTRHARTFFPKTLELVSRLPFVEVGRCNVMGLEAHDHGTVHRDGEPSEQVEPDHFVTLCPAANKRLFLWDEERREATPVRGRAYWFNDFDFHGVDADPFFRYSIRVDGVFEPAFLERVRALAASLP